MTKLREMIVDAEQHEQEKQKALNVAKTLITFAIYFFSAGTLMAYVAIPVMLKTIGFMLTAHAFYFLWNASRNQH